MSIRQEEEEEKDEEPKGVFRLIRYRNSRRFGVAREKAICPFGYPVLIAVKDREFYTFSPRRRRAYRVCGVILGHGVLCVGVKMSVLVFVAIFPTQTANTQRRPYVLFPPYNDAPCLFSVNYKSRLRPKRKPRTRFLGNPFFTLRQREIRIRLLRVTTGPRRKYIYLYI